jgi:tRNA U34 5-methylaminomethyl-2-thiouridine-forming methyltransferase MnmC
MENKLVITNDGSHSIFNPIINECYHSKHGAIVEAEHVFIRNGFSALNKEKLNILEVGFGTGLNALLTYQKAEQKLIEVNYQTMELYPVNKENYMQLNFTDLIGLKHEKLLNLHSCTWEVKHKISSYFTLTKNHTSLEKFNTDLQFDIIYFDAFSPEKQPELWNKHIFKKMHGFLKDDGFLVTYCAKGVVKRTMKAVGFEVIVLDGPPGKRQMTRGNQSVIEK